MYISILLISLAGFGLVLFAFCKTIHNHLMEKLEEKYKSNKKIKIKIRIIKKD